MFLSSVSCDVRVYCTVLELYRYRFLMSVYAVTYPADHHINSEINAVSGTFLLS